MTEGLDERVASCPTIEVGTAGFRNQPPGFDPRSGEGARRAGGRCNPPGSFPVLYLCLSLPCVAAELRRAATTQGLSVSDLLPREVHQIDVSLDRVLDLRDTDILTRLDLEAEQVTSADRTTCQEVGAAAHALGIQALWLPSATGVGEVLAVFVRNSAGRTTAHLAATWKTPADIGTGARH